MFMKSHLIQKVIFVIFFIVRVQAGSSQGFVNLNFESAQVVPLTTGALFPPYSIARTNALPGWTVYLGSDQQSQITYNDPSAGSTWVSLIATNDSYDSPLSGQYSVLLQGGLTQSTATISQTAVVPVSAISLIFEGLANPSASLSVSLGGQNLNYFMLASSSNYNLYGADISTFAGTSQQLAFSVPNGVQNNWVLDSIQFSSTPIPEPSVLGLSALGGLFLAWRRWRTVKSSRI